MPGNTFGTALRITTFGESHGEALGVVIDGLESNFEIDIDHLARQMARRRPGGNPLGTKRQEPDAVEILSGVFGGKTTGTPLAIILRNTNQRSTDYHDISELYRPGHADHTWQQKFGIRDWRGGGRSSGRETAARLAAGAIAMQILAKKGILIQDLHPQHRGYQRKEAGFRRSFPKSCRRSRCRGCRPHGTPD